MTKLVVLDALGERMEIEAEIGGSKVHGYILPSGGWSLYPDKDEASIPCEWIALRRKRKRSYKWMRKDFILEGLPK